MILRVFGLGLLGVWLLVNQPAYAADEQSVRQFASQLADEAIDILKDEELSKTGKQRRIEELFDSRVDVEWVAKFVLGKYWREASDEQKKSYVENYRAFVLKHYASKLTDYSDQQYEIQSARPEGDEGEFLVSMEIMNPDEPNVILNYRLREVDGALKIYDIIVEGVSMITTQRSEFGSVISRKGLDYLIDALGKKAA